MAARTNRIVNDANTRKKIQATQLINRLTKHILGEVEMSSTQVTAALGLLKKTLPDLSAIEHTGEVEHKHVSELSRAEIYSRIDALRTTSETGERETESNPVH